MRYERRGDAGTATRHVVLLPGFGVGSFHYDALSARLGRDASTCVWALDFCGQGASWPASDEASRDGSLNGFVYSVDAWRDQVVDFARTVVRAEDGVYLAGNSLGGFVATYAAATEESLVKGLILMNATPFWAFVPSDRESLVYKLTPRARGASGAELDSVTRQGVLGIVSKRKKRSRVIRIGVRE